MIKSVSLHTSIIDDMDLAVKDLADQLKKRLPLLRSSVGIVQCDPEFIEAGIMPLLHDALGITLVGGTTVSVATNDIIGNHIFSLMVLTSDDVEFSAGHTTGLVDNYEEAIGKSMQAVLDAADKPLRFALIFPTVTDNESLPGDCYVEAVEKVCGNVPVFGTLSVDDALREFNRSMSVYNGEAFTREATYVLMFGEAAKPRFFVATVPKAADLSETSAVVTKADGHIVQEINNMPAVKYFESVGLAENGDFKPGVYFVPILVTTEDDEGIVRTFVRALISFDENGHVSFRGKVPPGAVLTAASLNAEDILDATTCVMTRIAETEDTQAVLIYSCIIRQLNIGSDTFKELAQIKDTLRPDVAFAASYSGGEIAPISNLNAFHNYSLIACLL
ncbi:MAG: FIST C-terminal domain-containing protein [Clostridiales bacterium]|jgi:hypothetical protein|nr:FIST C-terminal domain-containing protein [Clostridiales bacterium]